MRQQGIYGGRMRLLMKMMIVMIMMLCFLRSGYYARSQKEGSGRGCAAWLVFECCWIYPSHFNSEKIWIWMRRMKIVVKFMIVIAK